MSRPKETNLLTLSEHLTKLNIDLERSEIQYLATKVAKEYRERYPDEVLKKAYRTNHRGKSIAIGIGYDQRVLEILDKFIEI